MCLLLTYFWCMNLYVVAFLFLNYSLALLFGECSNTLAGQVFIHGQNEIVADNHNLRGFLLVDYISYSDFHATGSVRVHGSPSFVIISKNSIPKHFIVIGNGGLEFCIWNPQVLHSLSIIDEKLVANNDVSTTLLGHLDGVTTNTSPEANSRSIVPFSQKSISHCSSLCKGPSTVWQFVKVSELIFMTAIRIYNFGDNFIMHFNEVVYVPPPEKLPINLKNSANHYALC